MAGAERTRFTPQAPAHSARAPEAEPPDREPGAVSARDVERPVGETEQIRVPRLLVAASEISWRLLVCIAAGGVFVYAFTRVGFVAFPVLIALLLSTLLVPPAHWLQRRGLPPALATTVVFLAGIALFAGVATFVGTGVAHESDELSEQVSQGADELGRQISSVTGLEERDVQEQINTIDDRIRENSDSIRNGVVSGAAAAGQLLGGLALTLVILFFFVKDGPRIWDWLCRLFPPGRRAALDDMANRTWMALQAYVRGVVFVAFVDAVGIGLGLFALGVPLALPLAVLTFILAFVPIVGAIAAGAAAVLVALVSSGAGTALAVLGIVLLVQQLEGNVLYPIIVGRTVDLHPLVVLLSVAVGGALYGIVGAALAVPIALMVMAAAGVVQKHSSHGEVAVGPQQPAQDPP